MPTEVCFELPTSQDASSKEPTTVWTAIKPSLVIVGPVIAIYLLLSIWVFRAGIAQTGTMVFPLDDTYITMGLAKNLALHGVMGISGTHFAPASSCPGFLLLLAGAYLLTGPNIWWPMALSLAFGLLALIMARRLLADRHWGIQLAALLAILFFTPVHIMGLLGMEHTLHLLLVLAFLDVATDTLAKQKSPGWGLILLTSFMVSVRYESLFIIAVACLLFLVQRNVFATLRLGLAAASPVVAYSAISVYNGCYWLPHSIALKGLSGRAATRAPLEVIRHLVASLAHAPYLGALLGMIVVLLTIPGVLTDNRTRSMLDLVFGGILLHLAFADVGWVYRYEAYLVGTAIATIAYAVPYMRISRDKLAIPAFLVLALAGTWMLTQRAIEAQQTLPFRSAAVYKQQIQMARFLSLFGDSASVAANDVGAISYFTNVDCLDLVGLGDRDIFWLKRKGMYTTPALTKRLEDRNVKIAVIYDAWFSDLQSNPFGGPGLPLSWIRVARWHTPYGQYLGGDTVSFYASDPIEAAKLKPSLASFAPSLPAGDEVLNK